MTDATAATADSLPERARHFMDIAGVRQAVLLLGVAAAIAIGGYAVLWSRTPDYSLLYANLADRDAGAIVNALQAAAIPYELERSSGAIMVPTENVHEARLKLAADGLPQGSGLGFELIGDEQGFGVSQFMENARYQHMLETELVRTITSLRPVRGARVHLAMPKQSVFVRDRRPGSASVVVELYPGRQLEKPQVASIVHLVASSIPDIEAGQVTVVDQTGRMLTDAGDEQGLALTSRQFEYKTRVEQTYMQRIEDLLVPLVGAGRVRAQVTAAMDFTVTEQTLETYDSDQPALRSEQSSNQQRLAEADAAGIPGALSNQPPTAEAVDGASNARSSSSSATRNYELDRTVSHVRQPIGTIDRLSVAVIVDERQVTAEDGTVTSEPLAAEEIARMTTLVQEAVGFDVARGDTVNIINAPFIAPTPVEPAPQAWWDMPLIREGLRQLVGLVLVLGVIFGLLRPTVRQLLAPPPALALPAGDAGGIEGLAPRTVTPTLTYEQRLEAARSLVGEDPKRAARVMKDWMAEDG